MPWIILVGLFLLMADKRPSAKLKEEVQRANEQPQAAPPSQPATEALAGHPRWRRR
ncbi:hypothetical protein L6R50_14825 [Myxococcota bacterium]|nr:hypothetical protein [Myxococcota bacterium]